jgi:hypothetical protein
MHFPLPLCVLSFATLGAVIAPKIDLVLLAWTYFIIFGSLCLASYCFDELKGRPWNTRIPDIELRILGWTGLGIALFGGIYLAIIVSPLLLLWIPPSIFVILGYNMELFNGRLHNKIVFALGWGGLPTFGSYFLQTLTISIETLLVALATVTFSFAIWILNHELRTEIGTFDPSIPRGELKMNRTVRREIWNIDKILCYMITFFTIAFTYYRFFQ